MHILMISNEFPPSIGGVQTHVFELSRSLVSLGHTVEVVTRKKSDQTAVHEILEGVKVHRLPLPKSHWLYDLVLSRALKEKVRNQKVDLIHVHGTRPLNACRGLSVPVIFTNHTSSFLKRLRKGKRVRQKMARQLGTVDYVIAPSHDRAQATQQAGFTGPLIELTNGVDLDRFSPGKSVYRENLRLPDSAFVVLFSGRLHPIKGIKYLAEALEQLNLPELHLLVAGSGTEKDILESAFHRMNRADQLHFLGSVPNAEIPNVYRAANLLVLPSIEEATSISGLEAMACGLPILGSDVGGIPTIVDDGLTGKLVPKGDSGSLAEELQELVKHPDNCQRMGCEGRRKAEKEFSWEGVAGKTEKVYRTVLERTSLGTPE